MAVLPRAVWFTPGVHPAFLRFPGGLVFHLSLLALPGVFAVTPGSFDPVFFFQAPQTSNSTTAVSIWGESQTTKHCPWSCIFISRLLFEACNLLTPFKVSDCLSPVLAAWNEEASSPRGTPVALSDRPLHGNSSANQLRSPHGHFGTNAPTPALGCSST